MGERKIGVWLIGALGSISTTVVIGAILMKKGLADAIGMITETDAFKSLDFAPVSSMEFAGCDVRRGSLYETGRQMARETGVWDRKVLEDVETDLREIEGRIDIGTVRNCGDAIESMADSLECRGISLREEVSAVRSCLQRFKLEKALDEVVVVNLASTEPPLALRSCNKNLPAFEKALDENDVESVRASSIYAYASILEGCPYVNFTPSNGALTPAILELARKMRVPVMGNDGKTGETLVKSVLAPLFLYRNLEVLSWEGFNILGNMDGRVLDNPGNKESKIKTKDRVLSEILGYQPHSRVHIDYVPSLDDQKTAWDFIHFKGFLGVKMSLQFVWQGYDSILAAPLVLDLARFADLAKRRGEYGLMPHLASYFKAPLGVDEHRLHEQFQMLLGYAGKASRG